MPRIGNDVQSGGPTADLADQLWRQTRISLPVSVLLLWRIVREQLLSKLHQESAGTRQHGSISLSHAEGTREDVLPADVKEGKAWFHRGSSPRVPGHWFG